MADFSSVNRRKKVEYLELVYDLVFVFLVMRCDEVIQIQDDGFFGWDAFETYLFSVLLILQIWAYSVLFINRYGKNVLRDFIFLGLNMYLLCMLGIDTSPQWALSYLSYQIAWGCVTANLAVNYALQLRRTEMASPRERRLIKFRVAVFCAQAAVIFLAIPVFNATGFSMDWIALFVGYLGPVIIRRSGNDLPISMDHLAERIMLLVVLSFGETLTSVAEYFEDGFTPLTIYLSAAVFIIAIGMLLAYGYLYSRILDKKRLGDGSLYMFVHVFLILAINDVTIGIEMMREPESDTNLTLLFLVTSFLAYYSILLFLAHKAGKYYLPTYNSWLPFGIISGAFIVLMIVFREDRHVNAGISAAYPIAMFAAIFSRRKEELREHPEIVDPSAE